MIVKKKLSFEGHPDLQEAIDCLKEAREAYQAIIETASSQPVERLKDLDRQRDLDFTDLRYSLRAQLRHRQANRQEAANSLYEIIESYKDILGKPQLEQSAGLKAFFKVMESKDNQAKLILVGCLDYYKHLKASQEKFDAAYLRRVEGRSQRQLVNKEEARKHLLQTYQTVYRYLLCLEFFGKRTAHQDLLGLFNDVRLALKEAHARKAGQVKKKAKPTEPVALLEEPLDED